MYCIVLKLFITLHPNPCSQSQRNGRRNRFNKNQFNPFMPEDTNIRSQMRKGILEYCVLLLLSQGKAYPSDIITRLSEASLIVVEGTLYTLLNRLRKEGKLSYEWQESTMGPPRKYYFITDLGRNTLIEMSKAWDEIVENVNHFRQLNNLPSK